jgi:N-acetylmuramoyl-L-alanine amidase
VDRTNPADVSASLARWRERESRYRRNWKSKRKSDPRRAYWLAQLKNAKVMVDRRTKQLEAIRPDAPRIIDLKLEGDKLFGGLGPISGVIGHYTAGPRDTSDDHACDLWRGYHRAHKAKGWGFIGYHLGVTAKGSVVLLRPIGWKGAHTAGANTGHVGVVVHGTTGDQPTAAQAATLRWLAANAHTDAMPASHRAPRRLGDVRWTGHNDWNATGCPGSFKKAYTSKGKTR